MHADVIFILTKFAFFIVFCVVFEDSSEALFNSGDREHATALILACRHLPQHLLSSPGEKAGMLHEAAKVLERLGDKKQLQECQQLMMFLGSSVAKC